LEDEKTALQSELTEANNNISELQGLLDAASSTILALQEQLECFSRFCFSVIIYTVFRKH